VALGALEFRFLQPWWLLAGLLAGPAVYWAWRNLSALGRVRQALAAALRAATILLLAAILAQPALSRRSEELTLITILDRSRSVPQELQDRAMDLLDKALADKPPRDQAAVVEVAEQAAVAKPPGPGAAFSRRSLALEGTQSRLADGVQLAMAIAPPATACRLLLVSDGNQTDGDLREAARAAAANHIPIDVLPLEYHHEGEVIFRSLVAPVRARSGQTIPLRMVLTATSPARGRLLLSLNGKSVDLDPTSDELGIAVQLQPGTNVKTVSVPAGSRGVHDFRATFVSQGGRGDRIAENNQAGAITVVSGSGHVLVAEGRDASAEPILAALREAHIEARRLGPGEFPNTLVQLADCDAVVLVNVENAALTFQQQDMLHRYVTELGGGLVMVGGPRSFGAGGWIGSSLAEVLPVDCDPPQKKQMPQASLVLVIDRSGSMTGRKLQMCKHAAIGAVQALSRLDYVGVVTFDTQAEWAVPFQQAQDKDKIAQLVRQIPQGGGTDMNPGMELAAQALAKRPGGIRHVILLTDGQTNGPDECLAKAKRFAKDSITVSTVGVGPDADIRLLGLIAQATDGRFYAADDPNMLPQIFIREAQVVRRSLVIERNLQPLITYGLSDIVRGQDRLPPLNGYVLTGPRGGLAQVVLASEDGDPILAQTQAGLGRCVAFTSSADSRWAASWLAWGGFNRFWEQAVRWAARPAQSQDVDVLADVHGQEVTLTVETPAGAGGFEQLSEIAAQAIGPDMSVHEIALSQVGPGRYRGRFRAEAGGGSYVVNLRYRKLGAQASQPPALLNVAVSVPLAVEYRDLADNRALLSEIAALTGGHVLGAGAGGRDLFNRQGVKFPQWTQPLSETLILVWLGVFLLDVAVRRLAIDFAAAARALRAALVLRRPQQADATLERLKAKRQEFREQTARSGGAQAAPPAAATTPARIASAERPAALREASESLELIENDTAPASATNAGAKSSEGPAPAAAPPEANSLQQLLKAKRQARQRLNSRSPDSTGEH